MTIISDPVGWSLAGNRKQKTVRRISGLKSGRGRLRNSSSGYERVFETVFD